MKIFVLLLGLTSSVFGQINDSSLPIEFKKRLKNKGNVEERVTEAKCRVEKLAQAHNPDVLVTCLAGNHVVGVPYFQTLMCSDKKGAYLSTKTSSSDKELLEWVDSSECNGSNGGTCLNLIDVQKDAPTGITVRCISASDENLPSVLTSNLNKQKNNTMTCETDVGQVLSTFSGKWWDLVTWVNSPACSNGPDRRCEYLGSIQKHAHELVEIECIEDLGNKKYKLACKDKQDGTILSTTIKKYKKLRQWAAGPK